ncbi:uncharacterized protein LOC131527264 isoform X2 [Onychostoma macrolepis]|uniref:uncharacterized protein LOC131527264 isoform X2 n=1 Tax=Onychostoma macrolepis TaxID=369639 RepID=UPI00272CE38B|nr:uncharacterized protein LOC131527264 isoform X2 [Onychostoma macrolepis]
MPDKQLWTKYAVRIFSDTDSYDMARFRARKAQETSHVEDSDGNGGRKVIPPRRFREEEVWLSQQRCAKQAGRFHENSESSQENEITSLHAKRTKQKKRSRITATAPAPAIPSVSTFQSETHHSSSTNQQFQEIYKLFEGLERRLHLKLDQMHADIKTALEAIQQSASQPSTSATASASDLTEVLEEPCKTVNELEDLCKMLKVVDFRKKIMRYLCLQRGGNLGDGIRRMLHKIGENSLWAEYSYKGRKGKDHFRNF